MQIWKIIFHFLKKNFFLHQTLYIRSERLQMKQFISIVFVLFAWNVFAMENLNQEDFELGDNDPIPVSLVVNSEIEIHGLENQIFLNGARGKIMKQLDSGRFKVKLYGDQKIKTPSVWPKNLKMLEKGSEVVLYNLKDNFNGLSGRIIKDKNETNESFLVKLYGAKDQEPKEIKAENVKLLKINSCQYCAKKIPARVVLNCGHEACALCVDKISKEIDAEDDEFQHRCKLCNLEVKAELFKQNMIVQPINSEIAEEKDEDNRLLRLQRLLPIVCSNSNFEVVKQYLDLEKINVNQKGIYGCYPIHLCSSKDVTEHLIRKMGANVNQNHFERGFSPLHMASHMGNFAVAKKLIELGATVNDVNDFQQTPLFMAIQENHAEIVELLLEKGANANHKSESGSTPLTVAFQNKNQVLPHLILQHTNQEYIKIARDYFVNRMKKIESPNQQHEYKKFFTAFDVFLKMKDKN